jgi:hypothetical protein
MKILLDECVDWRLSRDLQEHEVKTARQMGWATVRNGELLALASEAFDVFVTVDRKLPSQQNLNVLAIAVVVLRARTNRWRIFGLSCPACWPSSLTRNGAKQRWSGRSGADIEGPRKESQVRSDD